VIDRIVVVESAEIVSATIAVLWAICVAFLISRAARQFRAYRRLRPDPVPKTIDLPTIGVVVPARNEADVIERCLEGLAAQDYPTDRLSIVLVDDGSTDATAAIARRSAVANPRLAVMEAGTLPSSWTGKAHACQRGAMRVKGTWLCFIDADTSPQPPLLRTAIATAVGRGVEFLSLEPRQELITIWERLIIPAGLCALGFAGNVRRTTDPRDVAAAANGQFILVRRAIYERVGGHAAVRNEMAEDSALAAEVKAYDNHVALLDASSLISVRMYRNLEQLWEGLAKNVTETFGGTGRTSIVVGCGLLMAWATFMVPAWLALMLLRSTLSPVSLAAFVAATLASLAITMMHVAAARYFAIPPGYGLLFPVGYTLAAFLAMYGIAERRRGRIAWKGRQYPVAREPAPGVKRRRESRGSSKG
jgi:chlorobactene glucosyltransferase